MRKLPYQSSLQFIQRPQLLWNDIGDRKLWRGIQWIRRGPTVPSRLSWNAYQSNIPKPRSGVRWKHGMRRFSEYGNVASRTLLKNPLGDGIVLLPAIRSKLRCLLNPIKYGYLVGGIPTPLKNMSSSMGRMIPYIMENTKSFFLAALRSQAGSRNTGCRGKPKGDESSFHFKLSASMPEKSFGDVEIASRPYDDSGWSYLWQVLKL